MRYSVVTANKYEVYLPRLITLKKFQNMRKNETTKLYLKIVVFLSYPSNQQDVGKER